VNEDKSSVNKSSDMTRHDAATSIANKIESLPIMGPGMKAAEREWVAGGLGFWLLWHLYGGAEGLTHYGFHATTIHRKVSRFKESFGVHPDEFTLPGVEIDSKKYWEAEGIKVGPR
jgi:hypothetical protein